MKLKNDNQNQRKHLKIESFHPIFYCVLPEPLSKLLKNAKQNAANTDVEKVSDDRLCVILG